jgi:hypothetical protein
MARPALGVALLSWRGLRQHYTAAPEVMAMADSIPMERYSEGAALSNELLIGDRVDAQRSLT